MDEETKGDQGVVPVATSDEEVKLPERHDEYGGQET